MKFTPSHVLVAAGLASAGLLAACGGSDPAPSTSVTGSVVKGPVNGASVCAYKATAAGKGEQIRCTTSGAGGNYTLELEYQGDVVIEASGGTYTDEATNTTRTLSDPMQVVLSAQGGSATGVVTPLTSVAYSIAKGRPGGVTGANFSSAASSVATGFQLPGVNLANSVPVVAGSTDAYGRVLRAVSQFIANGSTLGTFQTFASPATLQAALSSAYATVNGSSITFNFAGITTTVTPGTGGTGGTGATGGDSCGITVSGSGTVVANGMSIPFNLPATKVCVTGVPAASCSASNAQLQSIASAGATPSGNYTLAYNYSYAPNDCSGAVATVSAN